MLLIWSISGIDGISEIHSFFFSNTRRHLVQQFNSLFQDVAYTFKDVVLDKTNNYLVLSINYSGGTDKVLRTTNNTKTP